MADFASLVRGLENTLQRVARNPTTQFGTAARQYLGATLLPERTVTENAYREDNIRYRSVIANAGTRYSPTQKKGGALIGSFLVELAESDIASELTSRDYDALLATIQRNASMEAVAQLVQFVNLTVNIPLIEWMERARWQAIVDATITLRGDNEYLETIPISNPAGHRVAQAAPWSTDSTDIFGNIIAMAQVLADKGYSVGRIITSRRVTGIMAGNDTVKTRTSRVKVSPAGQLQAATGRVTLAEVNGVLQEDGLPPIEQYDLQYRTSTGTGRFLADNVMVLIATTGRDEQLDLGDGVFEMINDTLGYAAVGRAAGQSVPGRVLRAEGKSDKPPRIECEGWQTGNPVITEPEAIAVITGIT